VTAYEIFGKMAELTTAVGNNLPAKVMLLKNNSLAEAKFEQKEIRNPEYGCDLAPIDFVAFAKACGADGFRCETTEDICQQSGRPSIRGARHLSKRSSTLTRSPPSRTS
jgi:pyruvate dehydrogenase (quinone)/pyruvate decarboxylase